jgi:hypothetical protein
MFQNCGLKQILRDAAAVSVLTDVTPGYVGDQNTGGLYFVARTTGFTAGTCLVDLLVSYNGTTYSVLSSYQQTIAANGLTYITVDGPVPAYVGIRLTPSVGPNFDGLVEVDAYGSGKLLFN